MSWSRVRESFSTVRKVERDRKCQRVATASLIRRRERGRRCRRVAAESFREAGGPPRVFLDGKDEGKREEDIECGEVAVANLPRLRKKEREGGKER